MSRAGQCSPPLAGAAIIQQGVSIDRIFRNADPCDRDSTPALFSPINKIATELADAGDTTYTCNRLA